MFLNTELHVAKYHTCLLDGCVPPPNSAVCNYRPLGVTWGLLFFF